MLLSSPSLWVIAPRDLGDWCPALWESVDSPETSGTDPEVTWRLIPEEKRAQTEM